MTQLSREAENLNWLVSNFAKSVPGAAHAIAATHSRRKSRVRSGVRSAKSRRTTVEAAVGGLA